MNCPPFFIFIFLYRKVSCVRHFSFLRVSARDSWESVFVNSSLSSHPPLYFESFFFIFFFFSLILFTNFTVKFLCSKINMFDLGDELTLESSRIPWLIWIQLLVLFLLIVLLYCFTNFASDPSDYASTATTAVVPTVDSPSTSRFLFDDVQQVEEPNAKHDSTATSLVINRRQNTQVYNCSFFLPLCASFSHFAEFRLIIFNPKLGVLCWFHGFHCLKEAQDYLQLYSKKSNSLAWDRLFWHFCIGWFLTFDPWRRWNKIFYYYYYYY